MRLIMITLLFAFAAVEVLSQHTLKCWDAVNKLAWIDFRGEIPTEEKHSSKKAVCPHEITVFPDRKSNILNYRVKLVFFKKKAWAKDTTSKYLLAHEQLHFDIGELYSRKLRKSIEEIRLAEPIVKNYKSVIEKLLADERRVQDEYDKETLHGVISENQFKWEKKIFVDLEKFKEFASTVDDCQVLK